MTESPQFKKLVYFQLANLVVSFIVWLISPLSEFESALVFQLFGIKLIVLLWLNEFPTKRTIYDKIFFGLSVADIVTFNIFGSFSLYTFGLSRLV